MPHYLDPKNDFIFKRIFGEHPDLLISFLNALMPLEPGKVIESVEYLSNEMVPENPVKKFSIVDVRCRDSYGRQFIVEMQMEWSSFFCSRLLFNTSKAFVRQLRRGENFLELQPVYGLGIINEDFDGETPEFYHHYRITNRQNTREVIKGMEFVLVELPKFQPQKWSDRRMAVLWLRFLKEVEDRTKNISEDLLSDRNIRKALDICEESGFTDEELNLYEQYWDAISTEKAALSTSHEEGKAEGLAETAIRCAGKGMPVEEIAELTALSVDEIRMILKQNNV
ncbi:MAG: Rpn family recombination-promoting nuclease/putative transposase [Bacteroidales bacterium]|jgi:predicted transposase/invertase (TIGR01784 family)|nr:Rpn family recombination-promoting nuclease/putative transposase [Bacteroidales bacterium]